MANASTWQMPPGGLSAPPPTGTSSTPAPGASSTPAPTGQAGLSRHPSYHMQAGRDQPQGNDPVAQLVRASHSGNVKEVKKLLDQKANVNASQQADGNTPLIAAAAFGHAEVVDLLLGYGADPNKANSQGRVALAAAAEGGHAKSVTTLVQAGAKVDAPSRLGDTPLFLAALRGRLAVLKALLDAGADPKRVTATNNTALIMAAQGAALPDTGGEFLAITKLLLQLGCPVDKAVTDTGVNAVIVASASGSAELVQLLLDVGGDAYQRMTNGSTALMAAVQGGSIAVVNKLLSLKLDPNAGLQDGSGPLLLAIEKQHLAIAEALIDHKADPNQNRADGLTPMIFATMRGNVGIVQKMIHSAGGDVKVATPQGGTPLVLACEYGHTELVELLIAQETKVGANSASTALIAAVSQNRQQIVRFLLKTGQVKEADTPFHIAVRSSTPAVVEEMLRAGVFIDEPGKDDQTPLFAACAKGSLEVSALLLKAGADPNFKRKTDGVSPLMAVCLLPTEVKPHVLVKLLLDKGADPDVMSTDGRNSTALCFAILNEHKETVKLLLDWGVDVNLGTPIVRAAQMGDVALIKQLGAKGADPSKARKEDKVHALVVAAYHGRDTAIDALLDIAPSDQMHEAFVTAAGANQKKVVERLIAAGVNVNKPREEDEVSALMLAAQMGDPDMVEKLIKAGCDVNYKRPDNRATPLVCACEAGREAAALKLLEFKADPNITSSDTGVSALIRACEAGQTAVVKALLERGSEVDYQNKYGQSALMAAAFYQHEDLIQILVDAGANPEVACGKGPTALLMGVETGNPKVVELLLKNKANILRRRLDNGETALMIAASHGHEEVALMLLMGTKAAVEADRGIQLRPMRVLDLHGHSCLWHALDALQLRIAEVLLVTQLSAERSIELKVDLKADGTLTYGPQMNAVLNQLWMKPPVDLVPMIIEMDKSISLQMALRALFAIYSQRKTPYLLEAVPGADKSPVPSQEALSKSVYKCPLTGNKIEHPMATADGCIFESEAIVNYLQKHQHDPTQQYILNDKRVMVVPYSLLLDFPPPAPKKPAAKPAGAPAKAPAVGPAAKAAPGSRPAAAKPAGGPPPGGYSSMPPPKK